jgi:hypothetical protein
VSEFGSFLAVIVGMMATFIMFRVFSRRKRRAEPWPTSAVLFAVSWLACAAIALYLVLA